tara:strand:+ start:225 stop:701 length:477 start_codon:yes stop_codon:yes gene_type:complete
MKNIKVKFDVWIQFLGMLGVLGGLVFVGLEMQQAHLIAEAGQQQNRSDTIIAQISSYNEMGVDWHSIGFENNPNSGNSLNLSEIASRNNFHQVLTLYESDFFQFSQGLMPESVWLAKLDALAYWNNQCNHREIMTMRKSFFPQELLTIINLLPDECSE